MAVEYDDILIHGTNEQFVAYDGEGVIDVDWREEDDAIIEYVSAQIPEAGLAYEWADNDTELVAVYKGNKTRLGLTQSLRDRSIVIRGLNRVLQDDYELRVFTHSFQSDTLTLYVKPRQWWAEMDALFPERLGTVFSKITAQTEW